MADVTVSIEDGVIKAVSSFATHRHHVPVELPEELMQFEVDRMIHQAKMMTDGTVELPDGTIEDGYMSNPPAVPEVTVEEPAAITE